MWGKEGEMGDVLLTQGGCSKSGRASSLRAGLRHLSPVRLSILFYCHCPGRIGISRHALCSGLCPTSSPLDRSE